ncbi:MAG: CoA transferase [Saprospiraceae bacterium]
MLPPIFRGFKVVELASVLAGPAVGLFFAEMGAEVTKIENATTGGDVTRRWKAPGEDPSKSDSSYYHSVNYGKRVLQVNLSDAADRQRVDTLIAEADLVVVNYRPGGAAKLGMDYERLSAMNPRLIYAEITGFGSDDPRPAFDVVLQAETGFLYLTGEPDGLPVKMPVALIDLLAAHQLKQGVLVALLQRERTGQGCRVSVSLYDAAIASLANQATNWLVAGYAPRRMGSQHPNIAPYGDIFSTADGKQFVLAVGVEAHFRELCQVLGTPDTATDERFATNEQRIQHREALLQQLQARFSTFPDREALLLILDKKGIPAGAIRDLPDVFAQPNVEKLLLNSQDEAGQAIRCVRSVVFEMEACG